MDGQMAEAASARELVQQSNKKGVEVEILKIEKKRNGGRRWRTLLWRKEGEGGATSGGSCNLKVATSLGSVSL